MSLGDTKKIQDNKDYFSIRFLLTSVIWITELFFKANPQKFELTFNNKNKNREYVVMLLELFQKIQNCI